MKDRYVLDRFEKGTNLGRFQTLVFQLRYIGKFSPDELTVLWEEEILENSTILPGVDTSMYIDSEGNVYLSVDDKEDKRFEHLYIVHTVTEGSVLLDNLHLWKDVAKMKIRNWWRNRWH